MIFVEVGWRSSGEECREDWQQLPGQDPLQAGQHQSWKTKGKRKKNCILMKKFAKYVHMDLFYVLVYSGPFDMHIEKIQKSAKKTLNGGGGMSFTEIGPKRPCFR